MDLGLHKTESCLCGKSYDQPGALKVHQRLCSKNKKRVNQALDKAKQLWVKKKRRRLEDLADYGQPSQEPGASEVCLESLY
jgi:hypothetical protein